MSTTEKIHRSSGNIYKDLDFSNADEMQAKALLVSKIISIIEQKKWTQSKTAEKLGLSQPKISLLIRGQFSGFSMEKLLRLLNKLDKDIEIIIRDKTSKKRLGHIVVSYAAAT